MTRRTRDLPERRRGELKRDVGSQRLSSAIGAQRRLNAARADGSRTKAGPFDLSDSPLRAKVATVQLAGPGDAAFQMCHARPAYNSTESQAEPIGDLYPGGVLGGKLRTDIGRFERRG